jgi:transcriptional regulator with XRE-family HTH domain
LLSPVAERPTDLPFADALRALMHDQRISVRDLAELTQQLDGGGLKSARVGHLVSGYGTPTVDNMVLLAIVLGVDPSHFLEYREHQALEHARRLIAKHGADIVLDKLSELD